MRLGRLLCILEAAYSSLGNTAVARLLGDIQRVLELVSAIVPAALPFSYLASHTLLWVFLAHNSCALRSVSQTAFAILNLRQIHRRNEVVTGKGGGLGFI